MRRETVLDFEACFSTLAVMNSHGVYNIFTEYEELLAVGGLDILFPPVKAQSEALSYELDSPWEASRAFFLPDTRGE